MRNSTEMTPIWLKNGFQKIQTFKNEHILHLFKARELDIKLVNNVSRNIQILPKYEQKDCAKFLKVFIKP